MISVFNEQVETGRSPWLEVIDLLVAGNETDWRNETGAKVSDTIREGLAFVGWVWVLIVAWTGWVPKILRDWFLVPISDTHFVFNWRLGLYLLAAGAVVGVVYRLPRTWVARAIVGYWIFMTVAVLTEYERWSGPQLGLSYWWLVRSSPVLLVGLGRPSGRLNVRLAAYTGLRGSLAAVLGAGIGAETLAMFIQEQTQVYTDFRQPLWVYVVGAGFTFVLGSWALTLLRRDRRAWVAAAFLPLLAAVYFTLRAALDAGPNSDLLGVQTQFYPVGAVLFGLGLVVVRIVLVRMRT